MMLATGSQMVLVFKLIQFRGEWTRSNGANAILYTAGNEKAEIFVVTENYAGSNVTYFFTVAPGTDVWVTYGGDAQVHIPTLCQNRRPGDEVDCG